MQIHVNIFKIYILDLYVFIYTYKYTQYTHILYIIFSHLAEAFIQSDLQMRTTEAINCSIKMTKTKS